MANRFTDMFPCLYHPILTTGLADNFRVELMCTYTRYARIVDLDMVRIQLPLLPVDLLPEGLGNMFVDLAFNELSHCFIDGFVDTVLYFVWRSRVRFAHSLQLLELLTLLLEVLQYFSVENGF